MGCSEERYADTWQMGIRSVLGLLTFVVALVLLSATITLAPLFEAAGNASSAASSSSSASSSASSPPSPTPSAIFLASGPVRLGIILVSAMGVGSYAYVSFKAPRPPLLHVYGLVLILGLLQTAGRALADSLDRAGSTVLFTFVSALGCYLYVASRAIFCKVLTDKLMVLGPPASRWQDVRLWGMVLRTGIIISGTCGAIMWALGGVLLLRGVPLEDIHEAWSFPAFSADGSDVPVLDKIVLSVVINLNCLALGMIFVSATVFMHVAQRLIRAVAAALAARGTPGVRRSTVLRTLRQHMLGIPLSLSTTLLVLVVAGVDTLNLLGREDVEDLLSAVANFLDVGGDVACIMFLSGIGTLLVREDPEAGHINDHIRSVLHAAVLTGRADFAFEGQVVATADRRCIASFPGKFLDEWKALTWLCERHELSTACVFLPVSDPQERYGEHTECPEEPGCCWCIPLYGGVKPWGCQWFQAWETNIQKAVELELELVVVFFPGQVGQGLVDWASLRSADLWDGCGLGGSQKGEAAYLRKRGIKFLSEDLDVVRSWLTSSRTPSAHSPLPRRSASSDLRPPPAAAEGAGGPGRS